MNLGALPACSPRAFEQRYREHADPWEFATSEYEQQRYAVTLRNLRRARYRNAFEPGCSIGLLTSALAERCESVLATEVSVTALARARARCAPFPNVRFEIRDLRAPPPRGPFDLIVFSEVGYYFDRRQLADIASRLAGGLEPGGEIVAVHWLGNSEDHVLHGDEVHAVLRSELPLRPARCGRYRGFRLDSWIRA